MLDLLIRADLGPNATRYELMRATPSLEHLRGMWIMWATASLLAGVSVGIVILAVLRSPAARSSAFNQYLVGMMVPDLILSIFCLPTCAINHANNGYISEAMCEFQSFYAVFSVAGSVYMNALGAPKHQQTPPRRQ